MMAAVAVSSKLPRILQNPCNNVSLIMVDEAAGLLHGSFGGEMWQKPITFSFTRDKTRTSAEMVCSRVLIQLSDLKVRNGWPDGTKPGVTSSEPDLGRPWSRCLLSS